VKAGRRAQHRTIKHMTMRVKGMTHGDETIGSGELHVPGKVISWHLLVTLSISCTSPLHLGGKCLIHTYLVFQLRHIDCYQRCLKLSGMRGRRRV
jgi:hypothetical protein